VGERVDPITVSVIQHRLHAIVEEMGEAMLRTSYSQILNSSRDFSTAICDPDGRLIAQAEHVPIHVGALPWAVHSLRKFFGDGVRPGDVYLLNDPYHGNNHLPDLTAFVPVFLPVGRTDAQRPEAVEAPQAERVPAEMNNRFVFWSINRSHQSDIGGATHGGYNPGATEIWQEGLRITPLKLYDGGVLREDLLHMIATNLRHPRDFRGDLAAMIGSARVGERRVMALLDEYGVETTLAGVDAVLDGAERQTRACIATWKDGVYRGEAVLDDDGHRYRDVYVRATVTKKGSDLTVDLSDSHPQVVGFVNSSYANMRAAVAMALAYLIDPHTPKNDGTFRPIRVIAREGTVVWANPPAPVTLCTNHCAQEIGEAVIKALAGACPDRAMAGWGRRFRIAIQGRDPRSGRPFIWHMFHARPGGGASSAGDGWPSEAPAGGKREDSSALSRSARNVSVFSIDSAVHPPMCGVMMRLSWARAKATSRLRVMPVARSSHRTSTAAPASRPERRACSSAASSTSSPRAELINQAPGFMRPNCSRPKNRRVSAERLTCRVTVSASRSNSGSGTSLTPGSTDRASTCGSAAKTCASKARR